MHQHAHTLIFRLLYFPSYIKFTNFVNEITNCTGKQGVVGKKKNDVMTALLSFVLFLASFGVILRSCVAYAIKYTILNMHII